MKKLFIDIRLNGSLKMQTSEITYDFVRELFSQTRFEYSRRINPNYTMHVVTMAYAYRLAQEFERRDLSVKMSLSISRHPNYPSWLLLAEYDDAIGNIIPIVAKYFSWDRIENQEIMTPNDLFKI